MDGQGKTPGQSPVLGVEATTNQLARSYFPNHRFDPVFLRRSCRYCLRIFGTRPKVAISLISVQARQEFEVALPGIEQQREFADYSATINAQQSPSCRGFRD